MCGVGRTGRSGRRQEHAMNFTLQGGQRMGHINSSPPNVLVIFLNKGLVRKGVGWLRHQLFSFPSASSCQLPLQFSNRPPLLLRVPIQPPEHHPPHSSPLSFAYRKFSEAEVASPALTTLSFCLFARCRVPFTGICSSPFSAAFWARRDCA